MIETNPFRHFIPRGATKLIVGSFPCFNGEDYGNWYYSGSGRNFFWKILSDITGMVSDSASAKKAICTKYRIALTDIAHRVNRTRGNCSDANLRIVEYNLEGIRECLAGPVASVFYTSRFVEKHFRILAGDHGLAETLLPSPSPAANIHIGGLEEYKQLKSSGKISSPYEYRLLKYRELLKLDGPE